MRWAQCIPQVEEIIERVTIYMTKTKRYSYIEVFIYDTNAMEDLANLSYMTLIQVTFPD